MLEAGVRAGVGRYGSTISRLGSDTIDPLAIVRVRAGGVV